LRNEPGSLNKSYNFSLIMVLLEGDQFLSRLTLMFDKARSKGHVDLCMKRYDGRTKPTPRQEEAASTSKAKQASTSSKKSRSSSSTSSAHGLAEEYSCLLRARYRTEKISTVVHARDLNRFQLAYCNLLKSHMDGLKRQKKQKSNKKANV